MPETQGEQAEFRRGQRGDTSHVSEPHGSSDTKKEAKRREGGFLEEARNLQFQSFCPLLPWSGGVFFLSSHSPCTHDD